MGRRAVRKRYKFLCTAPWPSRPAHFLNPATLFLFHLLAYLARSTRVERWQCASWECNPVSSDGLPAGRLRDSTQPQLMSNAWMTCCSPNRRPLLVMPSRSGCTQAAVCRTRVEKAGSGDRQSGGSNLSLLTKAVTAKNQRLTEAEKHSRRGSTMQVQGKNRIKHNAKMTQSHKREGLYSAACARQPAQPWYIGLCGP